MILKKGKSILRNKVLLCELTNTNQFQINYRNKKDRDQFLKMSTNFKTYYRNKIKKELNPIYTDYCFSKKTKSFNDFFSLSNIQSKETVLSYSGQKERIGLRSQIINIKKNKVNLFSDLHKKYLHSKLRQSKLYKQLQEKLFSKNKNGCFITNVESDDQTQTIGDIINNTNNISTKLHTINNKSSKNDYSRNCFKKSLKEFTDNGFKIRNNNLNDSKQNYEPNYTYFSENNNINGHKTKKKINTYDLSNLKEIKKPHLKFSSALSDYLKIARNDDDGKFHKESMRQKLRAKVIFNSINKAEKDYFKRYTEEAEINILNQKNFFRFQKANEKYFNEFDNLVRKYILFLNWEAISESEKLDLLIKKKVNLTKENIELTKKISLCKEKLKSFQNFKEFCIMLKHKYKNVKEIPEYILKQYEKNNDKTNEKNKSNKELQKDLVKKKTFRFNKRYTLFNNKINIQITNENSSKQSKETLPAETIKNENNNNKKRLVFKSTQEMVDRYSDIERELRDEYIQYNDSSLDKLSLENELKLIEEKNKVNGFSFNKMYNQLKIELDNLKTKNIDLQKQKNFLLSKQKNRIIKTSKKNAIKNDFSMKNIYKKIHKILFNPQIDLPNLVQKNNIYDLLNQTTHEFIKFNGVPYSKEIFPFKILEVLYQKLIDFRKECLDNKYLKKKYLKYENERKKIMKDLKSYEKKLKEQDILQLKRDLLFCRTNKLLLLPYKRDDCFENKFLYKNFMKKNDKEEDNNQLNYANDKYNELIEFN